jgi:hypothetical protein
LLSSKSFNDAQCNTIYLPLTKVGRKGCRHESSCNMSKVIWCFRLLVVVLVLSTLTVPLPADAHDSVVSLSGVGTATRDGQLAPGERDLAWIGKVNFLVNLPLADGSGTTPGALFVSQSAAMAASSTSFCGAPLPKLCIAEPGRTGLGLNRSYALLVIQNPPPDGEKSKPQLIYWLPFILLLALWAVLLFFRKHKK